MDISYLKDPHMSWAAKGLYTWLLTQEQGTEVTAALAVALNEDETFAALDELAASGVLATNNPLFALGLQGTKYDA